MKFIVVAVKGVKETLRDRKSLVFMLLFPLMFMVVFRMAFGWGAESNTTYTIAVYNLDDGEGPWDETDPPWLAEINQYMSTDLTGPEFFQQFVLNSTYETAGEMFIEEVLRESLYEDDETPLFDVIIVETVDEGEELVKDEEAATLVTIPANFSSALQGIVDRATVDEIRAHSMPAEDPLAGYADAIVGLTGSFGNMDYSVASSMVQGQLGRYSGTVEAMTRYAVGMQFGGPAPQEGATVQGEFLSVGETEEFTIFDFMAPGLMIFAIMMLAMGVTQTLANEVKDKTLNRLRLTKMRSIDLMTGTSIKWLFMGALQIIILFIVAVALGTHFAGNYWLTIPIAIGIAMVVVLASISVGLIISAFVEDPEQATNLATLIVVPLSFFTGAFFPLDVAFAQVLPFTQGANAMKDMLLFADGGAALVHTVYALIGGLVLFGIGVVMFSQRRLRSG
jgi:ABC-2 type transport system permease protein